MSQLQYKCLQFSYHMRVLRANNIKKTEEKGECWSISTGLTFPGRSRWGGQQYPRGLMDSETNQLDSRRLCLWYEETGAEESSEALGGGLEEAGQQGFGWRKDTLAWHQKDILYWKWCSPNLAEALDVLSIELLLVWPIYYMQGL